MRAGLVNTNINHKSTKLGTVNCYIVMLYNQMNTWEHHCHLLMIGTPQFSLDIPIPVQRFCDWTQPGSQEATSPSDVVLGPGHTQWLAGGQLHVEPVRLGWCHSVSMGIPLTCWGCRNRERGDLDNRNLISLEFWRRTAQDQGVSRTGFLKTSPWLVDGHLLQMSSHDAFSLWLSVS